MFSRFGCTLSVTVLLVACSPGPTPPSPVPTPTTVAVTPIPSPATPSPSSIATAPTIPPPAATATMVASPTSPTQADVPLAAMFLSWYGFDAAGRCTGGLGSFHWNSGPNTAGVIAKPEPGYYCSADSAVVSWQIDQLEKAGVQALFISWWGWGDSRLDGKVTPKLDVHINDGISALLKGIAAKGSKIRVALIVEPFTSTQAGINPDDLTFGQRQMVLDWLWQRYYDNADYRDLMFHWQGKPLLIAFDPMRLPLDPRFTVRLWTGLERSPKTISQGWQWFFGPPQDVVDGMSDDGVAFVYPRFDEAPAKNQFGADYITWPPRSIDPLLQQRVYEKQWQKLMQNRSKVKMIVLYGWNLYGEQAYIEPSSGGPAPVGQEYVARTKKYYEAFQKGEGALPQR